MFPEEKLPGIDVFGNTKFLAGTDYSLFISPKGFLFQIIFYIIRRSRGFDGWIGSDFHDVELNGAVHLGLSGLEGDFRGEVLSKEGTKKLQRLTGRELGLIVSMLDDLLERVLLQPSMGSLQAGGRNPFA